MPTRRPLAIAVLSALAAAAGCAAPRIEMFALAASPPPALKGKTVAVLPAMVVGTEAATAARCLAAQNKTFAGDLGGVRFMSPRDLLPRCRERTDAFMEIEEKTTLKLPTDAAPAGPVRTLFAGEAPPGAPWTGEIEVMLRERSDGVAQLGPDALPAETLAPFGGDYVLATAAFAYYREDTEITALFGILPIFGTVAVNDITPRALFVLYETASGAKVWEACIGTPSEAEASAPPLGIETRALPVLGAAFLLTGDILEPLARLASSR